MVLLYSAVVLAVIAVNVVIILLAADIGYASDASRLVRRGLGRGFDLQNDAISS